MDSILNREQKIAAEHFEGPMMVLAGPGSGKTTVITHRAYNLIKIYNIKPDDILVITFTKAASQELKLRFVEMFKNCNINFGTFHSIFFKILRRNFDLSVDNILSESDKKDIMRQIIISQKINLSIEEDFLENLILEMSLLKNELIDLADYNSICISSEIFNNIYNLYEKYKHDNNKIDFDDMLVKCYHFLTTNKQQLFYWQNRFKYILVDEFQDINKVQYEIIKCLCNLNKNIFVVGDDDQSIYGFRGAKPEFLLKFSHDFDNAKQITLSINYRSSNSIIKLCNNIISQNKNRFAKNIKGTNLKGIKPKILKFKNIDTEARQIALMIKDIKDVPFENMAVIYRINIQARAFVDAFIEQSIPFQFKNEVPTIYEHWISKDICAYLKLATNKHDNDSFCRIINKPKRYIQKEFISSLKNTKLPLIEQIYTKKILKNWQLSKIEELKFYLNSINKRNPYDAIKYIIDAVEYALYLKEYAKFRNMDNDGLFLILNELLEASKGFDCIAQYLEHVEKVIFNSKEKNNKISNKAGVVLSTIHSSKGLEFDAVFMAGLVEGILPLEKSKTQKELEEECRILYVGMTRAKRMLYLSFLDKRYENEVRICRFLKDIVVT